MNIRKLNEVLLTAFDTGSLTRLLKAAFNEDLEAITQAKNYREKVLEVVKWAERTGRLNMLLIEASRENPNNPKLKELLEATFVDEGALDVGGYAYEMWGTGEVASEFYTNQIIELNKQISQLSGEIRKLAQDLELLRQSQANIVKELSLRSAPISHRTEMYIMVCLGLLVLIGAFLAFRLAGAL